MAIATYVPQIGDVKPACVTDPMEIASQLAEGLLLLEQCQARHLSASQDLLDYVDWLLALVEELQCYGRIAAA